MFISSLESALKYNWKVLSFVGSIFQYSLLYSLPLPSPLVRPVLWLNTWFLSHFPPHLSNGQWCMKKTPQNRTKLNFSWCTLQNNYYILHKVLRRDPGLAHADDVPLYMCFQMFLIFFTHSMFSNGVSAQKKVFSASKTQKTPVHYFPFRLIVFSWKFSFSSQPISTITSISPRISVMFFKHLREKWSIDRSIRVYSRPCSYSPSKK